MGDIERLENQFSNDATIVEEQQEQAEVVNIGNDEFVQEESGVGDDENELRDSMLFPCVEPEGNAVQTGFCKFDVAETAEYGVSGHYLLNEVLSVYKNLDNRGGNKSLVNLRRMMAMIQSLT